MPYPNASQINPFPIRETSKSYRDCGPVLHIAKNVRACGVSGRTCPELERARLRVEIGRVIKRLWDLVRNVVEASGASAHFLDNPLQRMQRDLNTLSCHTVFDLDLASEIYGRLLLGLPANAPI
ncbi:MAG TPA: hypothetical protein DCP57_02720 [Gammaproteobacteria bacterium]|nr:hypothetical protein [Gammaproteobacteria bacterium]